MSESKQPVKRSSPRTKRAKVSQPPEDEDQALDLSLQKPKTSRSKPQPKKSVNIECPMMNQISPPADKKHIWGCLQFYESGKPVYCEYLSGDDPIEVNTRKIVQSKALTVEKDANEELYNSILKSYADWEHVLENGFTLKRKENGEYSSIEMRSMDMSDKKQPKYKIFVEDKQISIRDPTDIYEIYDGEKILGDKLKQPLGDMNKAYELAHCCHLIIAVYGEFMSAVGPIPLTYDSIRREMLPHYPYWFYLKIYPEFYLLDLKARQLFASNLK